MKHERLQQGIVQQQCVETRLPLLKSILPQTERYENSNLMLDQNILKENNRGISSHGTLNISQTEKSCGKTIHFDPYLNVKCSLKDGEYKMHLIQIDTSLEHVNSRSRLKRGLLEIAWRCFLGLELSSCCQKNHKCTLYLSLMRRIQQLSESHLW